MDGMKAKVYKLLSMGIKASRTCVVATASGVCFFSTRMRRTLLIALVQ